MSASRSRSWILALHHPVQHVMEIIFKHIYIGLPFSVLETCGQPLTFPNLVNGFDRNPQHAVRAAVYTRYTPSEWKNSNISAYTESDINRYKIIYEILLLRGMYIFQISVNFTNKFQATIPKAYVTMQFD